MESFTELMDKWPTRSQFASDCGQDYGVVHQWYRRNSIPAEHWNDVVNAAGQRGIECDLEKLATLRKNQKSQ